MSELYKSKDGKAYIAEDDHDVKVYIINEETGRIQRADGKPMSPAERGSLGGKVHHPNKGFGADRERAREAGRKGGSTRKAAVQTHDEVLENAMEYREDIDTDNQNRANGVRRIWERAFKR